MSIKHYATFYWPGSFVANTEDREVGHRDPSRIEWPKGAYSFRLYDREEVVIDGETLRGAAKNESPDYYHPDSKLKSVAEMKAKNDARDRILISNMETNGWEHVILCPNGWAQPYREGQTIILTAAALSERGAS